MAAEHETKNFSGETDFLYGALYFCSRWRMFPSIIMVHPYIYFVNEHFKKLQIRKILKIQQIRLAGRACRLRGTARTRRFERLRKQIQKAEARGCLPPLCRPCFTADTAIPLKGPLAGLAACAAQPERGVSSDCANRFKKPRRGAACPSPRLFGLPARIRTAGLQSRSLTCYPAAPQVDIVFRTI